MLANKFQDDMEWSYKVPWRRYINKDDEQNDTRSQEFSLLIKEMSLYAIWIVLQPSQ